MRKKSRLNFVEKNIEANSLLDRIWNELTKHRTVSGETSRLIKLFFEDYDSYVNETKSAQEMNQKRSRFLKIK